MQGDELEALKGQLLELLRGVNVRLAGGLLQ